MTVEQLRQIKALLVSVQNDPSLGPRYERRTAGCSMPLEKWQSVLERSRGTLSEIQWRALHDMYAQAADMKANLEAKRAFDQGKRP